MIYPSYLTLKDKVIIVSPSGSIETQYIDGAITLLEQWGLDVEVSAHARNKNGRFCGTVEQRLSDLQQAMDDSEAKMILCSRGGYGTVHLLNNLNFEGLTKHPKWIVGYSDITALHMALLQKDIVSLHAPMARHLTENPDNESTEHLRSILFGESMQYHIGSHDLNKEGVASGQLFGGNLAVLTSLMGSEYGNIPDNSILFIEDIAESAYKIDRMMWTLKLNGVLERISGIIIGSFTETNEDPLMYQSINESIRSLIEEYNIPVAFGFPVGHSDENYPLLHGANVKLEVQANRTILSRI